MHCNKESCNHFSDLCFMMLELFRNNSHKKKIYLSTSFFQDLEWFKKFLPHFNGTTIFGKPYIPESEALHSDMGAIWHNRVYSTPVPAIPGFDLKIVHLEMLNIIVVLRLWCPLWQHSQVKIFCDNEAVVQVVESSRTKDPFWGSV